MEMLIGKREFLISAGIAWTIKQLNRTELINLLAAQGTGINANTPFRAMFMLKMQHSTKTGSGRT